MKFPLSKVSLQAESTSNINPIIDNLEYSCYNYTTFSQQNGPWSFKQQRPIRDIGETEKLFIRSGPDSSQTEC